MNEDRAVRSVVIVNWGALSLPVLKPRYGRNSSDEIFVRSISSLSSGREGMEVRAFRASVRSLNEKLPAGSDAVSREC